MEHQGLGLEGFLQAQRAEGRHQDSSAFTLNQLQAREKLGHHLLGHSGLWLVKVAQAAVAAQASQISVTFGRRQVKVVFQPKVAWDAEELLHHVMSGQLPPERAISHLVSGLRDCSATPTDLVEWSAGETRVRLSEDGCQVKKKGDHQPAFELQVRRPSRGIAWKSLLGSPIGHVFRQTLDDWSALVWRCWPSPIPIVVDGTPLRCGYDGVPHLRWPHPMSVGRRSTSLHVCLGLGPISDTTERPELPCYPGGSGQEESVTRSPRLKTFLLWTPRDGANSSARDWPTARGAVALHTSWQVVPSMEFVLDGAVVESRVLDPFVELNLQASSLNRPLLATRYVFAVRPEEVDLSGFAVRNVATEPLLARSLTQTRELALRVRGQLPRYRGYAADERRLVTVGIETLLAHLDALDSST